MNDLFKDTSNEDLIDLIEGALRLLNNTMKDDPEATKQLLIVSVCLNELRDREQDTD